MKTLRRLALAALAAGLTSCHDDPEVVTVVVSTLANGLSVTGDGGSATLTTGVALGDGGFGGSVRVLAYGAVEAGTQPVPPVAPVTPAAPTTGATANAALDAAGRIEPSGNLLIGNLTTSTLADALFEATNGDLVVSGTLQAGDTGAGQRNLTLNAPNGTVFITGTVRTASVDGTPDGDSAGTLNVNAARIIVSGRIDASGEADSTGLGLAAGNGVTLLTSAGYIVLHTTSSILTSGGSMSVVSPVSRDQIATPSSLRSLKL